MNYAIVELKGHQYWVEKGKYINIDKIEHKIGSKIKLNKILFYNDGNNSCIGKPYLNDISIQCVILKHFKDYKKETYFYNPKKKTRKKQGYRKELTQILIESINLK